MKPPRDATVVRWQQQDTARETSRQRKQREASVAFSEKATGAAMRHRRSTGERTTKSDSLVMRGQLLLKESKEQSDTATARRLRHEARASGARAIRALDDRKKP